MHPTRLPQTAALMDIGLVPNRRPTPTSGVFDAFWAGLARLGQVRPNLRLPPTSWGSVLLGRFRPNLMRRCFDPLWGGFGEIFGVAPTRDGLVLSISWAVSSPTPNRPAHRRWIESSRSLHRPLAREHATAEPRKKSGHFRRPAPQKRPRPTLAKPANVGRANSTPHATSASGWDDLVCCAMFATSSFRQQKHRPLRQPAQNHAWHSGFVDIDPHCSEPT